jgi:hypothetical protein
VLSLEALTIVIVQSSASFHPLFGRRSVDQPARLLRFGMQVY